MRTKLKKNTYLRVNRLLTEPMHLGNYAEAILRISELQMSASTSYDRFRLRGFKVDVVYQKGVNMPKQIYCTFEESPLIKNDLLLTLSWAGKKRQWLNYTILIGEELEKWKLINEL